MPLPANEVVVAAIAAAPLEMKSEISCWWSDSQPRIGLSCSRNVPERAEQRGRRR